MSDGGWVQRAFIDPIRTVVLVDDEFPNYGEEFVPLEMEAQVNEADQAESTSRADPATHEENWKKNRKRAKALVESFRAKNWTADVVGGEQCTTPPIGLIEKADVVVLDYHLGSGPSAEERAIGLVRELAKAKGWRLVVMHSREPESNVLAAVRKNLEAQSEQQPTGDSDGEDDSNEDAADSGQPWVQDGGVFVIAVQKGQDDLTADVAVERLHDALKHWNPDPVQIGYYFARSEMRQRGADLPMPAEDLALRVGWLRDLYGAAEADRTDAMRRLWERVISSQSASVIEAITKLGLPEFAPPIASGSAFDKAKNSVPNSEPITENQALHALNAFLCSEEPPSGHLTTGTIFAELGQDGTPTTSEHVWICTSVSCDMVPAQRSTSKWAQHVDQELPLLAVRAAIEWLQADSGSWGSSKLKKALKAAEHGRHVFVRHSGRNFVAAALEDPHRQPMVDIFFVENHGAISGGTIRAHRPERGIPVERAAAKHYAIVGQLRPEYASRVLAEVGKHVSRIGVDFVRLR